VAEQVGDVVAVGAEDEPGRVRAGWVGLGCQGQGGDDAERDLIPAAAVGFPPGRGGSLGDLDGVCSEIGHA
jgi:hypothetical protein